MDSKSFEQGAWSWKSRSGYKPVLILIATVIFIAVVVMPPPKSMLDMLSNANPPGYKLPSDCKTIIDTVNKKLRPDAFKAAKAGTPLNSNGHGEAQPLLSDMKVARMAKITVAILFLRRFCGGPRPCRWAQPTFWSACSSTCSPYCH